MQWKVSGPALSYFTLSISMYMYMYISSGPQSFHVDATSGHTNGEPLFDVIQQVMCGFNYFVLHFLSNEAKALGEG